MARHFPGFARAGAFFVLSTAACASSTSTPFFGSGLADGAAGGGGSGGAPGACTACLSDSDCGEGTHCAQFAGDAYCASDCAGVGCATGTACQTLSSAAGDQVEVCVPVVDPCGGGGVAGGGVAGGGGGGVGGASGSGGAAGSGAGGGGGAGGSTNPHVCGALVDATQSACCNACSSGAHTCAANGCYGGWWCNTQSCKCQAPPSPATCGGGGGGTGGGAGAGGSGAGGSGGNGGAPPPTGTVGPNGGTLDHLAFAAVGDTRPPTDDDTAGYPTAVITQIWKDVAAAGVPFAVMTGDYMFANPTRSQSGPQIDLYLQARSQFSGPAFPALGNHECTGRTESNCGPNGADGVTNNYTSFLQKLLAPLGKATPYYAFQVNAKSGAWSAKFVFVAPNAWDQAQATWLDQALSPATTYTFVVRHESTAAQSPLPPGLNPSQQIISQHPLTLLLVGHTHTWEWKPSTREVVIGNGGAPLTGSVNYGYTVFSQRSDGAIQVSAHDYATNAVFQQFAVKADGTVTP